MFTLENKLKVEYVDIDSINPYPNNAKLHPAEQIEQIKKSIEEFGMNDPIGVWHDEVVEGHGRLIACKELEFDKVPIIRLDDLSEEQRRAYMLVHNQLTMNSGFDIQLLEIELNNIDMNMKQYGFSFDDFEIDNETTSEENIYTSKTDIPQYEPVEKDIDLNECFNDKRYIELIQNINNANITEAEKKFLTKAAARHLQFDYKKIACYYAGQASAEMQELMEQSALVIIDYNDAIKNGYAILRKTITELLEREGYEA